MMRLASFGWLLLIGAFGWGLQVGDMATGRDWLFVVFLWYTVGGVIFGVLNPQHWRLAPLGAWAITLEWLTNVNTLGHRLERSLGLLGTMVLIPIVGVIVGAYAGMALRSHIGAVGPR